MTNEAQNRNKSKMVVMSKLNPLQKITISIHYRLKTIECCQVLRGIKCTTIFFYVVPTLMRVTHLRPLIEKAFCTTCMHIFMTDLTYPIFIELSDGWSLALALLE